MTMSAEKNLAFISPFEGFSKLVREVCAEISEDVTVVEAYGDEALQVALRLQEEGYKALLARKYTVSCIKGKVLIPVIIVELAAFDLLQNMYRVSLNNNKKIGYISFWEETLQYDFPSFEKILGVEILPLPYCCEDDVWTQVRRAMKKNVDVVLTTGICIAGICKSFGLPAEVIYPSKNSIIQGVQRVKETLAARQRDIEHSQQLWKVINAAYDGVLVVDDNDQVTIINPQAEQMLGMPAQEIVGKPLHQVKPFLNHQNLSEKHNELIQLQDRYLVARKVPVKVGKDFWGEVITLKDVSEVQKLEQQIRKDIWEKGLRARFTFQDIIGRSRAIQATINQARRYAQSDLTILIAGESGTGKELLAQSIHNDSSRKNGPFVAVNCAAFPETLLDSELFGYDRGAFTGAEKKGKPGLFELAHRGTIFLDEISDLPFSLQAKLLRVLQEKEVRRISGDKIIPVDVRVLAATNKNLAREMKKGNFREDLYYRLNILTLKLPSLRERKEDLEELVNYFLHKHSRQQWKKIPPFDESVVNRLGLYHWPGNIRELENFIVRYVLLYESKEKTEKLIRELLAENFSAEVFSEAEEQIIDDPDLIQVRLGTMEEIELQILLQMVQRYKDKNKVARQLGISRTTLWKKLKDMDVDVSSF